MRILRVNDINPRVPLKGSMRVPLKGTIGGPLKGSIGVPLKGSMRVPLRASFKGSITKTYALDQVKKSRRFGLKLAGLRFPSGGDEPLKRV